MSKRAEDPLVAEIRHELMPGRFVRWDEVSRLVHNLDRVHDQVEGLVQAGDAGRAVRLYEIFLAGVYAKIEEADDECDLANLFHRLACGWIQARQVAGLPAEETVGQLLNWMKNDDYGFCLHIEKKVIRALDARGRQLFIGHFQAFVEKATPRSAGEPAKPIFEGENDSRLPALALKEIYESLGDVHAYADLCERLGFSPRDCERLAKMAISTNRWAEALEWVERGIAREPTRKWHHEDTSDLEPLKPEILRHLGRKEDALASVWGGFQENPNEFTYEQLMRYAPKREKTTWHERAMSAADKADLGEFISLCKKAKEWERLAQRIHSAKLADLEALSHYCTESAADNLTKRDPLAAARLYRALGLRIVNAGNSKYYREALAHFGRARRLYCEAGKAPEWEAVVQFLRTTHSRKAGFMSDFEDLVCGKSKRVPSFTEESRARWKRLTS